MAGPLFAGKRDTSMFRGVNRELMRKMIDTEVDFYKLSIEDTNTNIYGESTSKQYLNPIRVHSLIQVDEQGATNGEFGHDITQTARFAFLRDDLVLLNVVVETGDIISWNNRYWEVDNEIENQYFFKRNPDTNKTISSDFGWSVSIIFTTHETRKNKVQIEDVDQGRNDEV